MLRDTQKQYYGLNLREESYHVSTDDAVNLVRKKIDEAVKDRAFRHLASVYDYQSDVVRDGLNYEGKKIVSFAGILQHETFPLAAIVELVEVTQDQEFWILEVTGPTALTESVNTVFVPRPWAPLMYPGQQMLILGEVKKTDLDAGREAPTTHVFVASYLHAL